MDGGGEGSLLVLQRIGNINHHFLVVCERSLALLLLLLACSRCLHALRAALRPVTDDHGECEIKVQLNCSHCETQNCRRDDDSHLVVCVCDDNEVLASDNVTCVSALSEFPP